MARHQDCFACLGAQLDRCRYGVTVCLDVGLIKQLHGEIIDAAGIHRQADIGHQVEAVIKHRGHGLVGVGINLIGLFTENPGVICVSRVAFDAVHGDLSHRVDVRVDGEIFDAVQLTQFDLLVKGGWEGPVLRGSRDGAIIIASQLPCFSAQANAFIDEFCYGLRVEVDVGDRGKETVDHEAVDLLVFGAFCAGFVGPEGNAFHGIDQQVLQGGYLGLLAADTDCSTTCSFGCLLTLVTKHGHGFFLH